MSNPLAALSDIKIIDLSRVLAGPYCTQMLADYGANVIKIEQPGTGDTTRTWAPPFVGDQSAYFLCANRNKRSLTLNLKSPEGVAILKQLLHDADVLVENFTPGTMQDLGLAYDTLKAEFPRLIYCSISGYGQTGPYRERPGFDFAIQAEGGIMSITGPVDGEPSKVGVPIADITTGLFATNAIMAALHYRDRAGVGQHIDVALLDSQIAWLANVAHNYLADGTTPKRYGTAHPNVVPYQGFATSDGNIALAAGNDAQFKRVCDAIGLPELANDPKYKGNIGRVTNRNTLIPQLQAVFKTQSTDYWLETLQAANVPISPINDIPTALNNEQVLARHMVQEVADPKLGKIKVLGPVAKLSATPATVRTAPPRLGEHSNEVLGELGYSSAQIEQLRNHKTI